MKDAIENKEDQSSRSKKSSFLEDVFKLVGGTAVAEIIAILSAPILTRLYAPEAFGVNALFMSMASVIVVVSCLRYETAIMLPEKDEDAINLLGISLISVVLFSILTGIVVRFGANAIQEQFNSPILGQYIWLLPIYILVGGTFLPLNIWNLRKKKFSLLSVSRISSSFTNTSIQLGSGFSGHPIALGLIIANILGQSVPVILLSIKLWQDDINQLIRYININKLKAMANRYRRFLIYDTWSAFLTSISSQLPIFLLGMFFSPKILGYYSISLMVLWLPMNFVGSSLAQVFFQRAADAKLEGRLAILVESIIIRLGNIGFLPCVMGCLIGKEAFIFVFGSAWSEAGIYAQILSIWIFAVFLTSPISSLFAILERQDASLIFNIASLPIRTGILLIGGYSGNPRIAIALLAISETIFYAIALFWLNSLIGVSLPKLALKFIKSIHLSIPLIFIAILIKLLFHSNPSVIVILCGCLLVFYYVKIARDEKLIHFKFWN